MPPPDTKAKRAAKLDAVPATTGNFSTNPPTSEIKNLETSKLTAEGGTTFGDIPKYHEFLGIGPSCGKQSLRNHKCCDSLRANCAPRKSKTGGNSQNQGSRPYTSSSPSTVPVPLPGSLPRV